MKGDQSIIDALKKLLRTELTSVHQYFIHSEMYKDWGLTELYDRIHHEMEEETQHSTLLIERILFLEGTPDLQTLDDLKVGTDVLSMLKNDLQTEYDVRDALKEVIALCESKSDFETRRILEQLLDDTEADHIYWLEQQIKLINMIGIENYLQKKM